jgi:protease I
VTGALSGRRVAFLVANEGVEQVELTEPWEAVQAAGGTPELVAPEAATVQAFNHLDRAERFDVDRTTADITVEDYDGVVLPGGVANPDQLRTDQPAVDFVRRWYDARRPIAAICHGPWTLVEADVVKGRTLTSWPSLRTDIRNAGGEWVDREVQICAAGPSVLVTSRKPDDLPAFCAALIEAFAGTTVDALSIETESKGASHASASVEREAGASVRAHQGGCPGAGRGRRDRGGNRGPHRQQGTSPRRRSQGSQPHLDRGHLLGSPGRAAVPSRTWRSYPRPALQRSPREEHQGSLDDDEGRARAGRRALIVMATRKQVTAAKRNVKKAQVGARKKRSIANLPAKTRTALGKQGAAVARRKRSGGSLPKTREELYAEAKRRGLVGRSKMGRDELARALGHQ